MLNQFKTTLTLFLILACASFFISCSKTETNPVSPSPVLPDLTTQVSSSVSGFVTDPGNNPVEGALVRFGNTTTLTDTYGFFEFNNVMVVKILEAARESAQTGKTVLIK